MFGIFEAQGGSRNSVAGNGQASGPNHATASRNAVKERSGDTAFARAERERAIDNLCSRESGVALRFPPQSKTSRNWPPAFRNQATVLFEPLWWEEWEEWDTRGGRCPEAGKPRVELIRIKTSQGRSSQKQCKILNAKGLF